MVKCTCSVQSLAHAANYCAMRPAYGKRAPQLSAAKNGTRANRGCVPEHRASKLRCHQAASTFRQSSTASSERTFAELAEMSGTGLNKITARATDNQMGLVATGQIKKGEIMIQVPLAVRKPMCLESDRCPNEHFASIL
jgi:hypothetical protein